MDAHGPTRQCEGGQTTEDPDTLGKNLASFDGPENDADEAWLREEDSLTSSRRPLILVCRDSTKDRLSANMMPCRTGNEGRCSIVRNTSLGMDQYGRTARLPFTD